MTSRCCLTRIKTCSPRASAVRGFQIGPPHWPRPSHRGFHSLAVPGPDLATITIRPLASSQSSWFPFPRGSWTWPRYDYNSTTGDEEDALPIAEQCASRMWAHYYLACAVGYAFDVLYTDKGYSGGWFHGWCHGSGDKRENGLRTQFANFWALLAQEFKNDDAVLGFEILNEPWIGNWYNHPSFIIDFGNAEKSRLQPFYDIITNAIHKEDPRRIVFYEPTTFSDRTVSIYIPFYGPISIGVWGKMGLARPKDTNIVTVNGTIVTHPASFAYHYYAAVNPHMNKYLDTREEDAQRMDTPAIVTEFWTGGEDALPAMRHFEHDATTWFVWTYKSFRDNISASGNTDTDLSRVSETQPECHGEGPLWSANGILASCTRNIARPYSMALQGTLVSQYFNETSVIYTLTYRANPSDKSAATEIFVNTQVPDVPEKYKDAASRAYVPYFVFYSIPPVDIEVVHGRSVQTEFDNQVARVWTSARELVMVRISSHEPQNPRFGYE